MRRAFVADVHLANHKRYGGPVVAGMNERCRLVLNTFFEACKTAQRAKAEELWVLGDLFDTVRPLPQMIAAVAQALRCFHGRVCLLVGNHDQVSEALLDHALGPLGALQGVRVFETARLWQDEDTDIVVVPFQSGRVSEWLPGLIEQHLHGAKKAKHRILCAHMGVSDESTPPYLLDSPDQIPANTLFELMRRFDIDRAFVGNWHKPRIWHDERRKIVQCGALAPTGFDNPGPDYGFITFDEPKIRQVRLTGPRFLSYAYHENADDIQQVLDSLDDTLFLQLTTSSDRFAAAKASLKEWITEGLVRDGSVIVDKAEAKTLARNSAAAARGASTSREAVAEYIGQMALPDGVTPHEVGEVVQSYIAKAQ